MKKTKSLIITFILFFIIAVASTYYAYIADMNIATNKYIILVGLILEIVLLFVLYKLSSKIKKTAISEYKPIRSVKISKTSEMVLVSNKTFTTMENFIPNKEKDLSEVKNKVTLIHIDTVDPKKVQIRLFKEPVAMLDVVQEINK